MEPVEECISFIISKAAQRTNRRAKEILTPFNVTPTQYAVLRVLYENDGVSSADIGARLQVDSATLTGVIDRLVSGKLLRRAADDEDRRINRLYLTKESKSLKEQMDKAMLQLDDEIKQLLGSKTHSLLRQALRKLGTRGT